MAQPVQQPVRLSSTFGNKAPENNPIVNAGALGGLNSLTAIPSLDFEVGGGAKVLGNADGGYVPSFAVGGEGRRPRRAR